MRIVGLDGDLAVRAVAGTYVVLFGMDVTATARDGLLGFSIELSRDGGQSWFPLPNFVLFARNDQGAKPQSSSLLTPFQEFVWGDYTVLPGTAYVYRVSSIYGTPDAPTPRSEEHTSELQSP